MTEDKGVVQGIRAASLRIRTPLDGIEKELHGLREVLEERLPVIVQPRTRERFELTGEDRALIHAVQRCERDDCESCPFDCDSACYHRMRKDVLDLVGRLLAERGIDIDDL